MSGLILVSGICDTDYIFGGNLQSPKLVTLNDVNSLGVAEDASFNSRTVFEGKNLKRFSEARLGEQKEAGNDRKLYEEGIFHKLKF